MFSAGAYAIGGLKQLSKMREIEREGIDSRSEAVAKLRAVSSRVVIVGALLDGGVGVLCIVGAVLIHPTHIFSLSVETSCVLYVVGAILTAGGTVCFVVTLIVRRQQGKYKGEEVVVLPNIKYKEQSFYVPGRIIETVDYTLPPREKEVKVTIPGPEIPKEVRIDVPGPEIPKEVKVEVPGPITDYYDEAGELWVSPQDPRFEQKSERS